VDRQELSVDKLSLSVGRQELSVDEFSLSGGRQELSVDEFSLSGDRQELSVDEFSLSVDRQELSVDEFLLSVDRQELSVDEFLLSVDRQELSVDGFRLPGSEKGAIARQSPFESAGPVAQRETGKRMDKGLFCLLPISKIACHVPAPPGWDQDPLKGAGCVFAQPWMCWGVR
jgi:hypothetical protein